MKKRTLGIFVFCSLLILLSNVEAVQVVLSGVPGQTTQTQSIPANTVVTMTACGGGGSGGDGRESPQESGDGGGGGACASKTFTTTPTTAGVYTMITGRGGGTIPSLNGESSEIKFSSTVIVRATGGAAGKTTTPGAGGKAEVGDIKVDGSYGSGADPGDVGGIGGIACILNLGICGGQGGTGETYVMSTHAPKKPGQDGLVKITYDDGTAPPSGPYLLTINKPSTGGSGTVTGNEINCGTVCTKTYSSGTSVTLSAVPDANSYFAGWGISCSGTGQCSVIMDSAKTVAATFIERACAESQSILRLESPSDAHAEVWNGAGKYPIDICYNKIFSKAYTVTNPHDCSTGNSNWVISLNSSTNSHASNKSTPGYPINVCYGDLNCTLKNSACSGTEKLVVSLNDKTNAHLANDSSYQYKLCCKSAESAAPPIAICNNRSIDPGEACDPSASPTGCSALQTCNNNCDCAAQAKSITLAEWRNASGTRIVSANKSDSIKLFGTAQGFIATETLNATVFNRSTNFQVHFVKDKGLSGGNYDSGTTKISLFDRINNIKLGDKLYFILNNSEGIFRASADLKVSDEINNEINCCKGLSYEKCDISMPPDPMGSDPFGGCEPFSAPSLTTCHGEEPQSTEVTSCEWIGSQSTGSCTVRTRTYNSLEVLLGTCTTSYENVGAGECVDGIRQASVTVTGGSNNPICPHLTCQNPCGSDPNAATAVCDIPCRNVALLPFFTTANLIITAIVIIFAYLIIFKTKLFRNRKKSRKK